MLAESNQVPPGFDSILAAVDQMHPPFYLIPAVRTRIIAA